MSLLFNMLSRLVIAFLPRSNCLLISWLQSSSALILEPPKINSWIGIVNFDGISHIVFTSDPKPLKSQKYDILTPSWITALWWRVLNNSIKLWTMPWWAKQDGQVIVGSSDKIWSIGRRNEKQLQYSCRDNPMNYIKTQKYMTLKDELPRSEGAQYATWEEERAITNNSRKNEGAGPKWKQRWLWMCLWIKVKSNAVKNSAA